MSHSPIHKNRAMFIPDVRRPNMPVDILQVAEGKLEAHEHPDTLKSGELHKSKAKIDRIPSGATFSDPIKETPDATLPNRIRGVFCYFRVLSAASITWEASTAVVTLPTPPGTGVIACTMGSARAKSTSPQSFPSSVTLIPTSTTT